MNELNWLTLVCAILGYAAAGFGNALLGDPLGKLGEYLRDRIGL